MIRWRDLGWAALSVVAGIVVVSALYYFASATKVAAPTASSALLLSNEAGRGSAVHIGRGYVVTAAHNIEMAGPGFKVMDSLGTSHDQTVLWTNKEYDLALIRVTGYENIAAANVLCRPAIASGQQIRATGHPLSLKFISVRGHTASGVIDAGAGSRQVFVVDMTVVPGMSGGPVFNRRGDLIGVMVGVASVPVSIVSSSLVGLGYVVPSSSICDLLARE